MSLTRSNPRASPLEMRLLATAIGLACMPLFAAIASAQSAQQPIPQPVPQAAITSPAEIDRAVAEFTGAAIGEIGGARLPADRRLRLAACAVPLDLAWHGRTRATVRVSCAGPQSWRIFIATRAAPQAEVAEEQVVSRGDPITVVVRGHGFTVQQSAEALDAGSVGDWIGVRTERGSDPIRARIERPGLAVIPAS